MTNKTHRDCMKRSILCQDELYGFLGNGEKKKTASFLAGHTANGDSGTDIQSVGVEGGLLGVGR